MMSPQRKATRQRIAQPVVFGLAFIALGVSWAVNAIPRGDIQLLAAGLLVPYGAQELIAWRNRTRALGAAVSLGLGALLFTLHYARVSVSWVWVLAGLTAATVLLDMATSGGGGRGGQGPSERGEGP